MILFSWELLSDKKNQSDTAMKSTSFQQIECEIVHMYMLFLETKHKSCNVIKFSQKSGPIKVLSSLI